MELNKTIPENTVLQIKDLSIAFGGLKAVDSLTFDIKEKEIYGLIGPNGAGKTTVFNCITQFYKPNSGEILFKGIDDKVHTLTDKKVHQIIDLGLVRTFQNVELIGELTVMENVLIGAHIDFQSGILGQAFKLPKARKEENKKRQEALDVLEFLLIKEHKDRLVSGLPYGILKRVELARTLMIKPKLIILDEPAAGLNETETRELSNLIKEIRNKFNCAILLVEHDMRLVMDVSDRICAINFGKLLAIGSPEEIQDNKAVQTAYLGVDEVDE